MLKLEQETRSIAGFSRDISLLILAVFFRRLKEGEKASRKSANVDYFVALA